VEDAVEAAYLRRLVPAAVTASAELAGQGRPLSREALVEKLRRQGHAMSNARASALVKLVRDQMGPNIAADPPEDPTGDGHSPGYGGPGGRDPP
jgi:hypothetical protein